MKKAQLIPLLLVLAALGWYSISVPWHAINDGHLFLTSHEMITKDLFAYLADIFSSPNHSVQYRPLSFATYFVVGGKIWGTNPLAWELVSLIMFVAVAWHFYLLAVEVLGKKGGATVALTLLLLHPWQWIMRDWSFTIKYFMSAALMLYLCRLVWTRHQWGERRQIWKFHLLVFIGILCQEAAIVWPLQVLLLGLVRWRRLTWTHLTLLIWPCLYYLARQTFLQVDSYRFMRLDLAFAPRGFFYLLTNELFPRLGLAEWWLDASTGALIGCVLLIAALITVVLWKSRGHRAVFFILIGVISLAPFAALKDHLVDDRAFWGLPFFLLGSLALTQRWRLGTVLIAVVLSVSWLKLQPEMRRNYLAQANELRQFEARAKLMALEIAQQEGRDISRLMGEFNLPDAEDYEWMTRYSYHTGDNPLGHLKSFIFDSATLGGASRSLAGKIVLIASPDPKVYSQGLFYKWRLFVIALARELPLEAQLLVIPGMGQPEALQSWVNQPALYVTRHNYFYGLGWEWYFQEML